MGEVGVGLKVPLLKISKNKNDLSMKLFSDKHVSVVSIVQLFSCLVYVMWYDYGVISMINPCNLYKLDIALVYQNHLELFTFLQFMSSQSVIVTLETRKQ